MSGPRSRRDTSNPSESDRPARTLLAAAVDSHAVDLELLAAQTVVDADTRFTSCGGRASGSDLRAGAIRALSRTGVSADRDQPDGVIAEVMERATRAVYRLVAEDPPIDIGCLARRCHGCHRRHGRARDGYRPRRHGQDHDAARCVPGAHIATATDARCCSHAKGGIGGVLRSWGRGIQYSCPSLGPRLPMGHRRGRREGVDQASSGLSRLQHGHRVRRTNPVHVAFSRSDRRRRSRQGRPAGGDRSRRAGDRAGCRAGVRG